MSNENVKRVGVEFVAEGAGQFVAAIQSANEKLAQFGKQAEELVVKMRTMSLSQDEHGKALRSLEHSYIDAIEAVDDFEQALDPKSQQAATKAIEAYGKAIAEVGNALTQKATLSNVATKAENNFTTAVKESTSTNGKSTKELFTLVEQVIRASESWELAAEALKALGYSAKEVKDSLAPYIKIENDAAAAAMASANASKVAAEAREREAFMARPSPGVGGNGGGAPLSELDSRAQAIGLARLTEAQRTNRMETKRWGEHFTSASSAIGASRVGVALFIRELTSMAGANNVAVQALSSFVYATGTLGIALAAVTGAVVLFNEAHRTLVSDFETEQQLVAATASGYDDLYRKRITALGASAGGAAVGIPDALGALSGAIIGNIGQRYGDLFGRAFTQGMKGQLNYATFGKILADAFGAFLTSPADINRAAIEAFAKMQHEAATAQYVGAAAAREEVKALEAEIEAMHRAGTTADALIPKYYALQKAQIAAGQASGTVTGGSIEAQILADAARIQRIQRSEGGGALKGLDFLSPIAEKLATQLRDINKRTNRDLEDAQIAHAERMSDIAAQGAARRIDIERNYAQRLAEIQSNLNQSIADAQEDYAQRVADAEESAQEKRKDISETHNERRVKAEEDYLDRIAKIWQTYNDALFDIVARDDAKGLVRARLQRDRALAEAGKDKDKQAEEARKSQAKQERDLSESLERQKAKLAQDYERRLRELQQAAARQRASAAQSRENELADQREAQAQQERQERESNARRQAEINRAAAERRQALIDALVAEKGITEEYAKAIVGSLKDIVSDSQLTELFKDLQEAVQGKIEITVTPFKKVNASVPTTGLTPYANGGSVPYTMPILAHGGEMVLPANDANRAYALAMQHMGRMSVPMGGRSGGGALGNVMIYVDNAVNSALLNSQIRVVSTGVTTEIVNRAMQ